MRRTYAQYCPAARALDLVGERWTLLVVRELLFGPKRYTDLADGLPGIGPNVLADRLRRLQEDGLVRRTSLPPPAASTVYELTDLGEGLRSIVHELAKWGGNLLGFPRPGESLRIGWLLGTLGATFKPEAARGVHDTYEFRIDGEMVHVKVDDGEIDVREGHAENPDFVLTTDFGTFMAVGSGLLDPDAAEDSGACEVEGDREAGRRSIEILGAQFGPPPGGLLGGVQAILRPQAVAGVRESYEYRLGDHVFHVRADDGDAEVRAGPAEDPAIVCRTDLGTFLAVGTGQLPLSQAVAEGRVQTDGDPDAVRRANALMGLTGGADTATATEALAEPLRT